MNHVYLLFFSSNGDKFPLVFDLVFRDSPSTIFIKIVAHIKQQYPSLTSHYVTINLHFGEELIYNGSLDDLIPVLLESILYPKMEAKSINTVTDLNVRYFYGKETPFDVGKFGLSCTIFKAPIL